MARKIWAALGWVWVLFHLVLQIASLRPHVDSRGAAILAFLAVLGAFFWFAVWGMVRLFRGKGGSLPAWVRWAPVGILLMVLVSVVTYLRSGGMC